MKLLVLGCPRNHQVTRVMVVVNAMAGTVLLMTASGRVSQLEKIERKRVVRFESFLSRKRPFWFNKIHTHLQANVVALDFFGSIQ